jgi:alkanesulfonate monooxygenase
VPLEQQGPQDLRSISERLRDRVLRDQPTIRQLSQQVAGMGRGLNVIGTAEEIATVMQTGFEQGVCDGFNITPPYLPGGCDDFVDLVIPVLQERGLFRTAYESATLREHLGLKPAVSRYARVLGQPAAE